ncbi:hypothetical protein M9458_033061, partial [Cirrhinus mrigala]
EALEIFDRRGSWPVLNCLDPPLVHLDAVPIDDMSEVMDGLLVKLALLKLQIQIVLAKSLKDQHYVVAIFGQFLGVNKDVIDVDDDKVVE